MSRSASEPRGRAKESSRRHEKSREFRRARQSPDPSGLFSFTARRSRRRRSSRGYTSSRRRSATSRDVTLRALAVLAAADGILAEDTRLSRILLSRYGIETPLSPYHEHNAAEARPRALRRMAEGQALALISDAGTPLISDPGYKLVAESIAAGLAVTTAPGASASLAALCVAGLPTDRFFFEGFLPPKSAARGSGSTRLRTCPRRSSSTRRRRGSPSASADLALELGPRPAAVARELTKLHEEVRRGALDVLAADSASAGPPKGEIVVVVGAGEPRTAVSASSSRQRASRGLAQPFGQGRGRGRGRAAWAAAARGLCARARARRRLAVSARKPLDRAARRREGVWFRPRTPSGSRRRY